MRTFKIVLATLLVSVATVTVAAAGFVYSGVYNVAATSKHWSATQWLLSQTVHRSVDTQAAGITAPELGAEEQLLAGAANFDAMCSGCHAPPGAQPSAAAQGMYPEPPELTHAAREKSASEIFWVLKHGIKASGMPAWGASHSDDDLWAMTAFVTQLPGMSATDYQQMLQTADARGIGHGSESHHDKSDGGHGGHSHAEDAGADHGADDGHPSEHGNGPEPHSDSVSSAHAHT